MTDFYLDKAEEKTNTIWVSCKLHRPNGHKTEQLHIDLEFEEITIDEIEGLQNNDEEDLDFLLRKVKGWRNVKQTDGSDVPFDPDRFENLLNRLWFFNGVMKSVMDRAGGSGKHRRDRKVKN